MFLCLNLSGLIHTAVMCHEQKNNNWEQNSELQFPTQDGTVWLLCKQLSPLNEGHFYREAV